VCEQEFKVKKTSTQKYCSNKCMTNSKEVKEKRIKTSLKRYGVKNPAQSRKAKNSARKTSLERYGANSFPESKEFKKKYIDTMQKRYGVDNSFQLEQVKEKKKKTYLKRYGVDCPLKSKELKKKGRKTKLEKYGDETYNNHKQASITRLNHSYKVVLERISELVEPLFSLSEFDGVGTKKKRFKFKCLKCGNAFEDYLKDGHVPRCLNCYPLESFCGYSNAELELIDFIKSIVNTEIDHGNKKILNGKQLDLYLPEYKLAIEYDGLY